ncbi:MAG TPA: cation diffusion facilitator family transporter [Patescibacteria group bacterium]|nr:cation diffusion facilitator family transporter [Patescibacteria group bacterium]
MEKKRKIDKKLTARRIILTSFVVDALDVVLNFFVAILSGSVIMVTQVLEGVADMSASGFLLVGLSRSMRKEDKNHPFGYGREIYFWTLLSALIMFGITSTLSFYLGYRRFTQPVVVHDTNLALLVLAVTLFTNGYAFLLSLKRLLRNRSLKSIIKIFYRSSLVETKTTFTLDLMGTTASFLGLVALFVYSITGDGRFDGIGAMVIGANLAVLSIFLVLGIKDLLIGRSASLETEEKIKTAALSVEKVDKISDLKTLHLGSEKLLVSLDVDIKGGLRKKELERIIGEIELKIKKVIPSAKYVFVELE